MKLKDLNEIFEDDNNEERESNLEELTKFAFELIMDSSINGHFIIIT